jgi:hypothetical protein
MVCCAFVAAALGLVLAMIVGRRGDETACVRLPSPSYVPAVLERMHATGYPEGQLSPQDTSCGSTPEQEMLDHGRAQAQDVALEHP